MSTEDKLRDTILLALKMKEGGPQAKECVQPLGAGKGKETDYSLEPP